MTRDEIIYYVGIGIVVLVAEIGNQYGAGCIALPLLLIFAAIYRFIYPENNTKPKV